VVSNISGVEVDVSIVPEFRMEPTRFEYAATSYGGVVDYLIVKGPPASISKDEFYFPTLLISSLSVQNFYSVAPSSRLRTQTWSITSRQTFTKLREMGLGMQYLMLLWQVHRIVNNTSKYLWYFFGVFSEKTTLLMNSVASRGCATNGETWVFFVFNAADSGEGGTVSISEEFHLREGFSGSPLVLGLLGDWVSLDHRSSFQNS